MERERGPLVEREAEETLGHQIEYKVAEFMGSSFDCIDDIQLTENFGPNDKKGIDLVVTFENGDRMAIDVTADAGHRVDDKIKSMKRSPLVAVLEEIGDDGNVAVAKSSSLVPRALIRTDSAKWEEYNIENTGDEVIVYMPDNLRIQEEKDILQQLLRQVEYFSKEDEAYQKKTVKIKEMLKEALQEVVRIEKELR
jgi:hypothetical protein